MDKRGRQGEKPDPGILMHDLNERFQLLKEQYVNYNRTI